LLADDGRERSRGKFAETATAEQVESLDPAGPLLGGLPDLLDVTVWQGVGRQVVQSEFCKSKDTGEHIAKIVSQPACDFGGAFEVLLDAGAFERPRPTGAAPLARGEARECLPCQGQCCPFPT